MNNVRRGPSNDVEKREKILVVGSSMVRNIEKVVYMKDERSFLKSIGGAGIKQIMSEAVRAVESAVDECSFHSRG